jgi:hypothetical protein
MSENIYNMVFDAINLIRIDILGNLLPNPPLKYQWEKSFGQAST